MQIADALVRYSLHNTLGKAEFLSNRIAFLSNRSTLSKSSFLSGSQCHLRVWNDVHARDLATDPGISLQATFDTGQKVGELACKRYKGGHLVAQNHLHISEALENRDKRKRQLTFSNLRAYCERDTLALVGLHEAIKKL